MDIKNFSEFLFEKKKDKSGSGDSEKQIKDMSKKEIDLLKVGDSVIDGDGEIEAQGFKIVVDKNKVKSKESTLIWKPGDKSWFLKYVSQISDQTINITEEDLIKLGKEGKNIDSSYKWEKLYQFLKYCLSGEDTDYPENLRDKKANKPEARKYGFISDLKNIKLKEAGGKNISKILKSIKNDDIQPYTQESYNKIIDFVSKMDADSFKKDFCTKTTIKDPKDFKSYSDVIALLSGIYQPGGKSIFTTDESLPIFKSDGKDGWNESKEKEESEKEKNEKWNNKWFIPINPGRVKILIQQSETCIRSSKACIEQIKLYMSPKETDDLSKKIEDIDKEIEKIEEWRISKLGKLDEKEGEETGSLYKFWNEYSQKDDSENKTKALTDEERINLIKGGTGANKSGLTESENSDFLSLLEKSKKLIKEGKELADDGKMTSDEWFENIEFYDKDSEGKSVEVQEGLKSVMYAEVKEAFKLLQEAIENYSTGESEANALDQYIKVYNQFIEKAKSKYSVSGDSLKKAT